MILVCTFVDVGMEGYISTGVHVKVRGQVTCHFLVAIHPVFETASLREPRAYIFSAKMSGQQAQRRTCLQLSSPGIAVLTYTQFFVFVCLLAFKHWFWGSNSGPPIYAISALLY